MKVLRVFLVLAAVSTLVFVSIPRRAAHPFEKEAGPYPSDWFGMQRAFPRSEIPQEAFQAALQQAVVERAEMAGSRMSTNAALEWQFCGPTNIGGRVTCLAAPAGGT